MVFQGHSFNAALQIIFNQLETPSGQLMHNAALSKCRSSKFCVFFKGSVVSLNVILTLEIRG